MGFPMKQGILTWERVRLLLGKGQSCYRPRRDGERKRKSVRGCIVDGNLAVLNLAIVKKGEGEIPGLTDNTIPRRLCPLRMARSRNTRPPRSRGWSPQLCFRGRDTGSPSRGGGERRTGWLLLSLPRSWPRDRRRPRRLES